MAHGQGPRIYNLFPLLCGTVPQWQEHLPRIAGMGFDWVYVNPFHYPGFSGSIYAVKDYYRIHDRMGDGASSMEALLGDFCRRAGELGLSVMMDLVINHTSKDAVLTRSHPEWYRREADGSLYSPRAIDPADASKVTVWGDLAEIDYKNEAIRATISSYWGEMIGHFIDCGIRGFRCDAAYQVPADEWSRLIFFARFKRADASFFAETLGCRLEQIVALGSAGFDYMFNSAKWWDFKSPWLLEQYESFRRIAPSIAFPESHDTERLAAEFARHRRTDPGWVEQAYRQRYLFAATFSAGVMIPVGFEYGFKNKLDVVASRREDWEKPLFDLTGFIAAANRMKAEAPALNVEAPQRLVRLADPALVGLLRRIEGGGPWALTVINTDWDHRRSVRLDGLDPDIAEAREVTPGREGQKLATGAALTLEACEARVFVNV
jgi:starch synthase (maltosyl-transferring)